MNSLFKNITCSSEDSQDEVVPFSKAQKKTSRIVIRDLELNMFIGVLDKEKQKQQRVIVNVELDVEPNQHWQKDEISDVVSYADIIERIELIASKQHINLVETFAEKIAEICLSFSKVKIVRVSVSKPDIIDHAESVGVEITLHS
ncbi:MAG: dihydroneopterin aldolase [Pseudomonadota bacterium]